MQSILQLKNIEKSFGNTKVLNGINLEINPGEFISILGSSGCGKTTLLRLIAGLDNADKGDIILEGKRINDIPADKRAVNTVFQNYALFPHMNVEDNIGYALKLKKAPRKKISEKVKEMLSLVQLDGYEKRMPSELSGGQKQRISMARALVAEPKVLLLDEPLGALDLNLRRSMQKELKDIQKKLGISFIYITHDQEEALNMSDRIAVMHNGILEQTGTSDIIYNRPATSYVANFVGGANILRYGENTYALRAENILMGDDFSSINKDELFSIDDAVVIEKSLLAGLLKVRLRLSDSQEIVSARLGIDLPLETGSHVTVAWKKDDVTEVRDNGI